VVKVEFSSMVLPAPSPSSP